MKARKSNSIFSKPFAYSMLSSLYTVVIVIGVMMLSPEGATVSWSSSTFTAPLPSATDTASLSSTTSLTSLVNQTYATQNETSLTSSTFDANDHTYNDTTPTSGGRFTSLTADSYATSQSSDGNAIFNDTTTDDMQNWNETTNETLYWNETTEATTTLSTTTADPFLCDGVSPPPGTGSSFSVFSPRVLIYQCHHGYKDSDYGSKLIECKLFSPTHEEWVSQSGVRNPKGLSCVPKESPKDDSVPPWLPALIVVALIVAIGLLVGLLLLVIYVCRTSSLHYRRMKSRQESYGKRRKSWHPWNQHWNTAHSRIPRGHLGADGVAWTY